MKTALGAFGGVLATLLAVACWQARTTANAANPGTIGMTPAAQVECAPASMLTTPLYQPVSRDMVSLGRPTLVRYQEVRPAPVARRYVTRESRHRRSWAKTALVIGGSAGAGAGVGALAGGKKGALVGAAIGGGAASLWEALKR